MSRDRNGHIESASVKVQEGTTTVWEFALSTNPAESLTVSIAQHGDPLILGEGVMLTLYPEESKWPFHVKSMVRGLE